MVRVVALLVLGACGRIAFERTAAKDARRDASDAGDAFISSVPLVTGGTFYRGYDVGTDAMFSDTSSPATVSDFRLDRYEVTVARFRAFVDAGAGTQLNPPAAGAGAHAAIAASGWDPTWNASLPADTATLVAQLACGDPYPMFTAAPGATDQRPINCVSWYEAMAFCAWDGGYLPTEAEWDYAAAGGDEQRAYPWSQPPSSVAIDPSYASFYVDAVLQCGGDGAPGCDPADILDVGSLPLGDGRWGQSDLGGNMWEWVLDYAGAYPVPCIDCAQLAPNALRQIRGGAFHVARLNLRAAFYQGLDPATVPFDTGIRCARVP